MFVSVWGGGGTQHDLRGERAIVLCQDLLGVRSAWEEQTGEVLFILCSFPPVYFHPPPTTFRPKATELQGNGKDTTREETPLGYALSSEERAVRSGTLEALSARDFHAPGFSCHAVP